MSKQLRFKRPFSLLLALVMLLCLLPISAIAAPVGANEGGKDLAVYFGNWNVHEDPSKTVANIPWDRVTTINHAFWEIVPDEEWQSYFETYADGMYTGVYQINGDTPWTIRSTEPEADFGGELDSGETFAGHFAAYEEMSAKYPDVTIMLSIGGWSRTGLFSPMAATVESRAAFIQSCVDIINENPWLDGIDIDWEYPATYTSWNDPVWLRPGDIPTEQGCISSPEDPQNYTALLTELRAALDEEFGTEANRKQLTICAQSSDWTITGGGQYPGVESAYEFDTIIEILDRINIMTYDHAGGWTGVTHHTAPYASEIENPWSTIQSVQYYNTGAWNSLEPKYPEKLNIGFAAYARAWWLDFEGIEALGKAPVDEEAFQALKHGDSLAFLMGDNAKKDLAQWVKNGLESWITPEDAHIYTGDPANYSTVVPSEAEIPFYYDLCKYEADSKAGTGGWIYWLDESAQAPLITNNDPESPYYGMICSYDNMVSIASKVDIIDEYGLGGIILWATYGDATDEDSLIAAMSEGLEIERANPNLSMVTYDANGGKGATSVNAEVGSSLVLPANPTLAGHAFNGWYTSASGGSKISASTKVPSTAVTYYAQWTEVSVTKGKIPTLSKTKAGTIRVRYDRVSGAAGYRIKVSTSSKFSTAKSGTKVYAGYVKNEIASCKGAKLKKGTTYYVKVRAYKTDSTGAKVWGAYSSAVKITF